MNRYRTYTEVIERARMMRNLILNLREDYLSRMEEVPDYLNALPRQLSDTMENIAIVRNEEFHQRLGKK